MTEPASFSGAPAVRSARPEDALSLALVHTQCWQETYKGILSDEFLAGLEPSSRLGMWERILAGPQIDNHWVACDGAAVVGFAGRQFPGVEGQLPLPVRPVTLWGLYLLKSHQGLGLGRKLLEAALGAEPASLWVAAQNLRAIGFYRRFGFEPDGAEDIMPQWENLKEIRMVR